MIRRSHVWIAFAGLLSIAPVSRAQTDPSFFGTKLFPVLEAAGCRNCHAHDGVASGTRLHFPDSGATPDRVEAFGYSLAKLVDRAHPEQSLLLRKPTLRIPHTGGQRIKPGSPESH